MQENLNDYLKVYNEEFGLNLKTSDIDEILGIKHFNLKPYIWKPYNIELERFLQAKLKEILLNEQKKLTKSSLINICAFNECQGRYILISQVKEKEYIANKPESNYFSSIIVTMYNEYSCEKLKTFKKSLVKVTNAKYNRFKVGELSFLPFFRKIFNDMGLFPNKKEAFQCIYTAKFLICANLMNNNLKLQDNNLQGHHIFYDTQIFEAFENSILPISENYHTKEFHPDNLNGSHKSTPNIAKGFLYKKMFDLKYKKIKQKNFNYKVQANLIDILIYYFVENKTISEIQRILNNNKSKFKLSYNTISKLVEYFKQYNLVLTSENIDVLRSLAKK